MTDHQGTTGPKTTWQLGLLGFAMAVLAASWLVAGTSRVDFYRGWLLGYMACWEASIGCLGMLMLHQLTGGNWGRAARPAFDAGSWLLPLVAVGFLPIVLNLEQIFPWAGDGATSDPLLAHKAPYLNADAFKMRAALYFAVWLVSWWMLIPSRTQTASNHDADVLMPRRSALGLILLVVTASFAAIDWGMSLEPHWFSAIYGAMYLAGGAVVAMALAILAVAVLGVDVPVAGVRRRRIRRDLASLLLAMLMIWAYFAFSQFLIIWSANLPEENFWFLARGRHGWQYLAVLSFALHFFLPFSLLLSQNVRGHPRTLAWVVGLVLSAHAFQLLWTLAPAFYERVVDVSWVALGSFVGTASLWAGGWLLLLEPRRPVPEVNRR